MRPQLSCRFLERGIIFSFAKGEPWWFIQDCAGGGVGCSDTCGRHVGSAGVGAGWEGSWVSLPQRRVIRNWLCSCLLELPASEAPVSTTSTPTGPHLAASQLCHYPLSRLHASHPTNGCLLCLNNLPLLS